jgi:hypothetical protein
MRDARYGIRDTSRGIRDIPDPGSRIPNFESCFSRRSRASRATVCGAGGLFQRPARMTGAPVSFLQLFATEGPEEGLPWRKDCRALNLFKQGDRLQ